MRSRIWAQVVREAAYLHTPFLRKRLTVYMETETKSGVLTVNRVTRRLCCLDAVNPHFETLVYLPAYGWQSTAIGQAMDA